MQGEIPRHHLGEHTLMLHVSACDACVQGTLAGELEADTSKYNIVFWKEF